MLFNNDSVEKSLIITNKSIAHNVNKDKYEILLSVNNLFFQEEYERIINFISEIYPSFFGLHKNYLLLLYKLILFKMISKEPSTEVVLSFYQNYIIPLYDDEDPSYLRKADFHLQKIIFNSDLVRCRSFTYKLEEICKQFLINLEDCLKNSIWMDQSNNFICIDLFKDYYNDNFILDNNRLNNIEEDICQSYENNMDFNNDIYNYLEFNNCMDIDMSFEILESVAKPVESKPIKFLVNKDIKIKKLPIIKEFNLKFIKRENIDKKVLRKFKKYLKDLYKKNKLNNISKFWQLFILDNLMPPMIFKNIQLNENVYFKSFNTTYMLWLFSHPGGDELYTLFYDNNYQKLINSFNNLISSEDDKSAIINYLSNFAYLYTHQDIKENNNDSIDFIYQEEGIGTCHNCNNNIYDIVFTTQDYPENPLKKTLHDSFEKSENLTKMFNNSYDDFKMFEK